MLNNYYQIRRDYYGELSDTGAEHGIGLYVVSGEGACAGHFVEDAVHGPGAKTWTQGERYVGMFADNRKCGFGHHEWSTGASYTGEFKNNQPDGQGILRTVHDGLMFVGVVCGMTAQPVRGKWYTAAGDLINPHSVGVDDQGDRYTGERVDGVPHGLATLTTRVGETITGTWQRGVRQGDFIIAEKDFRTIINYVDGVPQSRGSRSTLSYGEAVSTYTGHFATGRYHGPGTYRRLDGYRTSGDYYFGEPATSPMYTSGALQTSSRSTQRRLSRNYAPIYDIVLRHVLNGLPANRRLRILELGVGRGEHMDTWRRLLPSAEVIGIDLLTTDTNPATPLETQQVEDLETAVGKHPHIHTGVDCYDERSVENALRGGGKFDIIIHDATHTSGVWADLELYRSWLNNAGCIITEEFASTADDQSRTSLNHDRLMAGKAAGWRVWDTRPLHHYAHWNSLIGVWSISDIDASPMRLYEV